MIYVRQIVCIKLRRYLREYCFSEISQPDVKNKINDRKIEFQIHHCSIIPRFIKRSF